MLRRVAFATLLLVLAACAGGRELTEVTPSDENTCAGCHEGEAAPALPAAPHGVHAQYACEECHVVPEHWADAGHLEDGLDDVVFGALASAGGATPSWDGESCRSVYCHGAEREAAIRWVNPGAPQTCGSCHGNPPAEPHPQAPRDCWVCHTDAIDADGVPRPETHIDGTLQLVRWTGAEGQAECGACHEAPPPAPHPAIDDCGLCHSPAYEDGQVNPDYHFDGQFQLIVYTAADDQPACGACHAVPPAAPHLQNEDCALCHSEAYDEDGNLDPSVHINTQLEVLTWSDDADRPLCGSCHAIPPESPHPQNMGVCRNCHGDAYLGEEGPLSPEAHMDGQLQLIVWTGATGQPACGDCHAAVPPAPHPQDMGPCANCHGDAYDENGDLDPTVHIDGTLDRIRWTGAEGQPACGDCHAAPPAAPHPQDMGPCTNCHGDAYDVNGGLDPEIHVDGTLQLIRWTGASGQPACGSCHSLPPRGDHPMNTDCASCHSGAYSGSSLDPDRHLDGEVTFGGEK